MTPLTPPEKDIGPFYKLLGAMLAIGALALFLVKANQGKDSSWIDLTMAGIILTFVLALWRPDKFDLLVKTIANKLPSWITKYEKPPEA